MLTAPPASKGPLVPLSQIAAEQERHYEERIAALEEQLAEALEQVRAGNAEHEMDKVVRDRKHLEQISQLIGENLQMQVSSEKALPASASLAEENRRLLAENAALRVENARLAEQNEALAEAKASLQTQVESATWQLYEHQMRQEDDVRVVPARRFWPRCENINTGCRDGSYYCRDCRDFYNPHPSRE